MNRINFADYAIKLSRGMHLVPEHGLCVMEAVCYIMAEKRFTDYPQCACPVVANLAIHINDTVSDRERQLLLPYVLRIAGSRTSSLAVVRQRDEMLENYMRYAVGRCHSFPVALGVLDAMLKLTEQVEPTPAIETKLVELTALTA